MIRLTGVISCLEKMRSSLNSSKCDKNSGWLTLTQLRLFDTIWTILTLTLFDTIWIILTLFLLLLTRFVLIILKQVESIWLTLTITNNLDSILKKWDREICKCNLQVFISIKLMCSLLVDLGSVKLLVSHILEISIFVLILANNMMPNQMDILTWPFDYFWCQ